MAKFRLVQIGGAPQVFFVQHLTRELAKASLSADKPFEGLPASIEWSASAELRIAGLRREAQAHGVHLAPA